MGGESYGSYLTNFKGFVDGKFLFKANKTWGSLTYNKIGDQTDRTYRRYGEFNQKKFRNWSAADKDEDLSYKNWGFATNYCTWGVHMISPTNYWIGRQTLGIKL